MKVSAHHSRDPLTFILSILIFLSVLGAWQYTQQAVGIDYYVAWVAADAVKQDNPLNIYDESSRISLSSEYRKKALAADAASRENMVTKYVSKLYMTASPFLYWVIGLLSSGDYETDLSVWNFLSLFSLLVSVLVMCRLLAYSLASSLAMLLPLVVWFVPLLADLRVANVNSFQLGLIGLILWLHSRDSNTRYLFAAGLVTGLTVMFKPNLAPVALLLAGGWVVRRQYARLRVAIAGILTGVAGAVLVSSWWMGDSRAWIDWLLILDKTMGSTPREASGNISIMTQFIGALGPLGQLGLALSLSFLVLVFLWWGRRANAPAAGEGLNQNREFIENTLLVAMGALVQMLASALVWTHYYLLTVPMLIVAFRPWLGLSRNTAVLILMKRVLPGIALLGLLDTVIRYLFNIEGTVYWMTVSAISVLALFVVGLWQLRFPDWPAKTGESPVI